MGAEKQVRVFISSTFRDMHAERDHLVTVAFPELRERVEQLGLEFFDVDLRWGVPTKGVDGEKANSWEYCKKWINEVEPFFVCILGQRYGFVPESHEIRDATDRATYADMSITEMEVRHAVFSGKIRRRSFFYFRKTFVPANADATARDTYVEDEAKVEKLKALIKSSTRPVREYPCEWVEDHFAKLDDFGAKVLDDLWAGVLRDERYVSKKIWQQVLGAEPSEDERYTDESKPIPRELWEKIVALAKPKLKEPLDAEREQMDAFAQARLRWFQGRTKELKQLTDFINSTDEKSPRLAAVVAAPGQGKSALLAKLSTLNFQPSAFVISHFAGATERSASAHALVERLLGELDRSGITWPTEEQAEGQEPKRDFNSLCLRFVQRLGDYAGERRLVILLDALNQLSDGHDLHWLPTRLGPGVRVIISCVEDAPSPGRDALPHVQADQQVGPTKIGDKEKLTPEHRVLRALDSRQLAPLRVPLGPLMEDDVRTIVVAYLAEYCHELDREHLDTLCAITQARNPLYLLVMLNELRTLGGNDLNRIVPARIASMPHDHPDTVSLFRWVLQRLEVFGPEAVRWWCLYLAHGRAGMASHELADLLALKLGADAAATALRIERGLRRYLQRRGPQLDFFHSQLRQAVFEQYGPQGEAANVHADIATYFHEQNNFLETLEEQRARALRMPLTPRKANRCKAEELVFQRLNILRVTPTVSAEFDRAGAVIETLLLDLHFLEAKVEAGLLFDLLQEFRIALNVLQNTAHHGEIKAVSLPLQHLAHILADEPCLVFPLIHNALVKGTTLTRKLKKRLTKSAHIYAHAWLKQLNQPVDYQSLFIREIRTELREISWMAFAPVGARLAVSDGQLVRVFDLASGEALTEQASDTFKGFSVEHVASQNTSVEEFPIMTLPQAYRNQDRNVCLLTDEHWLGSFSEGLSACGIGAVAGFGKRNRSGMTNTLRPWCLLLRDTF